MSAPRYRSGPLAGWGNVPVQECHVYRPDRLEQLAEIVARGTQPDLAVRGLGRSYGDASLNAGRGVVVTGGLDRMLAFDPDTGVLACEAGVSLSDIIDLFLPRGFFFPVTPGTKYITVGGAIASDVHGKNHHRDGSMSSALVDFRLLTARGEILTCSAEENAELFRATTGGMGLTGVILDARIRLRRVETAYMRVDYERAPNLDVALERTSESDADYAYAVTWIDCLSRGARLGRSVLMRGNPAGLRDLPRRLRRAPRSVPSRRRLSVPFDLPAFVLNPATMRLFNGAFYRAHRNATTITAYDPYFYPLDSIQRWNRIYGKRGVVQYQLVLPFESSREGLIHILERIPESSGVSFLAVLKRFGPAGEGHLSFPTPGYTLALDFPNTGPELLALIARLDRIVLEHGGRVYLSKDCCLAPESFRAMYPRLGEFQEIKAKVDPELRFSSSLARRLEIVPR